MKLLHIDSSPLGEASASRQLSGEIVQALRDANPGLTLVHRDLAAQPQDHLTGDLLQVIKFGKNEGLTPRQMSELEVTGQLVQEFLAADIVVIGAPMYNFSVPTQLKAWIDRIAQPGKTFRYTEKGPVGLAAGKKVIIASTRGGRYAGTPMEGTFDHQEAYLRAVMLFFGITDVTVIRAEGIAISPDARQKAFDDARKEIHDLVS